MTAIARRRELRLAALATAERSLPIGFAIVGVQKAGTTSLYTMLTRHPAIVGGPQKELRFFLEPHDWSSPDYRTLPSPGEGQGAPRRRRHAGLPVLPRRPRADAPLRPFDAAGGQLPRPAGARVLPLGHGATSPRALPRPARGHRALGRRRPAHLGAGGRLTQPAAAGLALRPRALRRAARAGADLLSPRAVAVRGVPATAGGADRRPGPGDRPPRPAPVHDVPLDAAPDGLAGGQPRRPPLRGRDRGTGAPLRRRPAALRAALGARREPLADQAGRRRHPRGHAHCATGCATGSA